MFASAHFPHAVLAACGERSFIAVANVIKNSESAGRCPHDFYLFAVGGGRGWPWPSGKTGGRKSGAVWVAQKRGTVRFSASGL